MLKTLFLSSVTLSFGASALAADLPPAPVPVPTALNWTGFYIGLNMGVGLIGTAPLAKPMGGFQLGYNYELGQWVVGAEADLDVLSNMHHRSFNWVGSSSRTVYAADTDIEGNEIGTARLRLGYAFDRVLPFVTGGLAYGGMSLADTFTGISGPLTGLTGSNWFGTVRAGYAVGGGLEYAFTDHLSVKSEYLHFQFANVSDLTTGYLGRSYATARLADRGFGQIVRFGLNYHFSSLETALAAER
ncbi:MAG TPA: outer membrane beta-barrel protein [Beijerinckia sp.]|jgi:outer membrane immunogenic protein|nr:outer membrane beta-barrel protein [Beijerinckia sp.]